jgi:hypothetical protein
MQYPDSVLIVLHVFTAGRILIAQGAVDACKIGTTIAIRYAAQRPQFGDKLIMDYLTHQRRLLPGLASTFALHLGMKHLKVGMNTLSHGWYQTPAPYVFSFNSINSLVEDYVACWHRKRLLYNNSGLPVLAFISVVGRSWLVVGYGGRLGGCGTIRPM